MCKCMCLIAALNLPHFSFYARYEFISNAVDISIEVDIKEGSNKDDNKTRTFYYLEKD